MKHRGLWLLTAALLGVGAVMAFACPPKPTAAAVLPPTNTNAPVLRTNPPLLNPHAPRLALGGQSAGEAVTAPGVYVAEPFNCLVVVPAAELDDRCLIGGGAPAVTMPTLKPELRLVPFGSSPPQR